MRYFIVWRASQAGLRYTTYRDAQGDPHAFTLDQLDPRPTPAQIADTPEQFERLRDADNRALRPDRRPRIAVNIDIAPEVLGWPALPACG